MNLLPMLASTYRYTARVSLSGRIVRRTKRRWNESPGADARARGSSSGLRIGAVVDVLELRGVRPSRRKTWGVGEPRSFRSPVRASVALGGRTLLRSDPPRRLLPRLPRLPSSPPSPSPSPVPRTEGRSLSLSISEPESFSEEPRARDVVGAVLLPQPACEQEAVLGRVRTVCPCIRRWSRGGEGEKRSLSFSNRERQMFLYRLYVKKSMRLSRRWSSSSLGSACSMAWLKRLTYHATSRYWYIGSMLHSSPTLKKVRDVHGHGAVPHARLIDLLLRALRDRLLDGDLVAELLGARDDVNGRLRVQMLVSDEPRTR